MVASNDFENELDKTLQYLANRWFSRELRSEQKSSLRQLYGGGDLLAILPTGFGKSLIFQLLALMKKGCVIIVVCPLKRICKDQIKEAMSMGITATSLAESLEDVANGRFQLVFASAEEDLDKDFMRLLKCESKPLHKNLAAIIVDECHTVETWTGKRSKSKKTIAAFRASFGKLAVLRSLCRQGTPVAALTGTADEKTRAVVEDTLAFKKDFLTVYVSPNRANLRFTVKKVKKKDQLGELQWLINLIKQHSKRTPKTLIFCNTINEIVQVNYLLSKLGASAYDQQIKEPENCFLGIYHSNSWGKNKERITTSLKEKENGIKRVIIATTALCMEVNFPDIRYVITWGAARSLLDFHQEAGRAGRDGQLSHVIAFYHGQQIGPCEMEVKEFLRSDGCIRVAAYISLDNNIKPLSPAHNCCSFCATTCECNGDSCSAEVWPFEKDSSVSQETSTRTRDVSNMDRNDLREALQEVAMDMNKEGLSIDHTSSHGYSEELINDVVSKCSSIFTIDHILSTFPVFSVGNAVLILEILQEIFLDIPELEATLGLLSPTPCFNTAMCFNFNECQFYGSDSDTDDGIELPEDV